MSFPQKPAAPPMLSQVTFPLWDKTKSFWDIESFHFPTSSGMSGRASERVNERSGARKQSEQCGASEWVSGVSKWANGQASGPVFSSRFLAVQNHCGFSRHDHIKRSERGGITSRDRLESHLAHKEPAGKSLVNTVISLFGARGVLRVKKSLVHGIPQFSAHLFND